MRTFADEGGRELLDLPDAPRPDPQTPAPVRFLYDYDNLLLLPHADRTRFVAGADYGEHGFGTHSNEQPSTLLVDDAAGGTWKVTRIRHTATLVVRGFRRFTGAEREAVAAEGAALLGFLHPGAAADVHVP